MDEMKAQPISNETSTASSAQEEVRTGFCQECGRGLTATSLRRVGANVFCDPCASVRQAGGGWQSVDAGTYRGSVAVPSAAPYAAARGPNPVLAGFLGFIPGVGAMFNGQYGKGAMHLIVFVVLVALADNLNWVLWWLVWGWIFYQVFDAFHTAKARREGLPLPNPFGWNDAAERMGFGRAPQPSAEPFAAPQAAAGPYAPPLAPLQYGPQQGVSPNANWAGYVPPQRNDSASANPFAEEFDHNPYAAPYAPPLPEAAVPPQAPPPTSVPFSPTYTGVTPGPQLVTGLPARRARCFPTGAIWLIGLGVVFLLGNLLPEWRLNGRWLVPIILAVVAFWSAVRRWATYRNAFSVPGAAPNLPGAMVGPVVLLTISVLLGLQAGYVLALSRSWPVLLVVWGTMLLLQRSAAFAVPMAPQVPEPLAQPVRNPSGTGTLGL